MNDVKWNRVLIVVGIVALIWYLSQGGTTTTVVTKPPFTTDKPSCLIVWDSDPVARAALTSGQLDILDGTAEGTVRDLLLKSGGYPVQKMDKNNTGTDFTYPWMKEARSVEMKSYPWMVMATPKNGLSIPIDKDATTATVTAKIKPLLEGSK